MLRFGAGTWAPVATVAGGVGSMAMTSRGGTPFLARSTAGAGSITLNRIKPTAGLTTVAGNLGRDPGQPKGSLDLAPSGDLPLLAWHEPQAGTGLLADRVLEVTPDVVGGQGERDVTATGATLFADLTT